MNVKLQQNRSGGQRRRIPRNRNNSKGRPVRFKAAWALLVLLAATLTQAASRPNVIIFFTDDQGWADTSVRMMKDRPDSRSEFFRTPALEKMAQEGMIFSNAYAAAPTCTPSRAGLQFGKTPARLRQTVVHDRLAFDRGIDGKDQMSIPGMIKAADPQYVTAHFGKWGFHPRSPEHAGYDQSDGNTNNGEGDYSSVKDRTPLPPDDPKRIFSITRRATEFMEEQAAAGRPFFLQLSHYAVHVDHSALPETVERYGKLPRPGDRRYQGRNAAVYAAMIENLDTALGMILTKCECRLYNLAEDIGEQNDLAAELPDKARQLHRRLLQYLKDVDAEDVEDMRQARKKEVEGYRDRELEKPNPDPKRLRDFERTLRMFEENRKLGLDGKTILIEVEP